MRVHVRGRNMPHALHLAWRVVCGTAASRRHSFCVTEERVLPPTV